MRRFRILLLLLLTLALPVSGVAGLVAPACCCPAMAAAAGDHAEAGGGDGADCCNDAETAVRTGQPCKAGQDCPTGGSMALPGAVCGCPHAGAHEILSGVERAPPEFTLSSIWRPPARI